MDDHGLTWLTKINHGFAGIIKLGNHGLPWSDNIDDHANGLA